MTQPDEAKKLVAEALQDDICQCQDPYFGAQVIGITKCERCSKLVDKALVQSVESLVTRLVADKERLKLNRDAALGQLRGDIIAMGHAEERIQFLEAVLYAVRGCAGTCAKCKALINEVDAQGRSTEDAEKASHRP